jgi:hypothetical protein
MLPAIAAVKIQYSGRRELRAPLPIGGPVLGKTRTIFAVTILSAGRRSNSLRKGYRIATRGEIGGCRPVLPLAASAEAIIAFRFRAALHGCRHI